MNTTRSILLAAAAVVSLGTGSALANSAHDPDPYTYTTSQGARADASPVTEAARPAQIQVGVYDNHGKQIGLQWVPNL